MATKRLRTLCQHLVASRNTMLVNPRPQPCLRMQHQTTRLPVITAERRVALYDEKIKITLSDLPCNERVTLHGQFVQGERKVVFASCGHYLTNDSGQVSVWEQPSTGGTYTGLEPMGIVWSLQPAPGQPPHTRMSMKFINKPCIIHLHTYLGHLELEDIHQSDDPPKSLASVELERWLNFPDVTRVEVSAGNVRGVLYLPPGEGPFQGVIDMFGSSGGIIEYRAALLASNGFAALSLPYFRYKDLVKNLGDVTFDYFEEAVKWFSSHPKVFPHGIGVVAVSKGVEFTYCMSAWLEQVKCAVVINGMPYFNIGDLYWKGKVLCKGSGLDASAIAFTEDEGMIFSGSQPFTDNLIPAWQGNTKHLILVSEDDFQLTVDSYKFLLEACPPDKRSNFEVVRYPGAGHLLEPPYTALCRTAINPTFNLLCLFGGQRKEHAHAQEDSWQRIICHLRNNIPTA